MKLFLIVAGISFILFSRSISHASPPPGHARFELLGMLDEYAGRPFYDRSSNGSPLDSSFIEHFYRSEATVADHFEKVLRKFCVEESLPQDWHRLKEKKERGEHIYFTGKQIASSINTSYSIDPGYAFRAGVIAPSVLQSASHADMLRYVAGAYIRYGDYQSAHRALFYAANNFSKFCVLTDFLSRLGCRNLRYYNDSDTLSAPTVLVLTFTPSSEVKAVTGIRREVTVKELNAMDYSHLKEKKLPHFH